MTVFEEWLKDNPEKKYMGVNVRQLQDKTISGALYDISDNLKEAFEAGRKHPEWIPVTERLPIKNDSTQDTKFNSSNSIKLLVAIGNNVFISFFCLEDNQFYTDILCSELFPLDIEKWHPLPEV
jgi:hypothetical protein